MAPEGWGGSTATTPPTRPPTTPVLTTHRHTQVPLPGELNVSHQPIQVHSECACCSSIGAHGRGEGGVLGVEDEVVSVRAAILPVADRCELGVLEEGAP